MTTLLTLTFTTNQGLFSTGWCIPMYCDGIHVWCTKPAACACSLYKPQGQNGPDFVQYDIEQLRETIVEFRGC